MKKIAFFDIDGTITSELDGSILESTIISIRNARKNGNLMFINTGRCFQNVEERFRSIGFDGYICGCGTNIYCDGKEVFYNRQPKDVIHQILDAARRTKIDILFESRDFVSFDLSRPLSHPGAIRQHDAFLRRDYDMPTNWDDSSFTCDKFVIWFHNEKQLTEFRKTSDLYFECIDRGGTFREFIPYGYSKATGINFVLDYYGIPLGNAYAFGDSNNDLSMLLHVPNSVAMGNSLPTSLFDQVSYVTAKSSENGIKLALEHFGF